MPAKKKKRKKIKPSPLEIEKQKYRSEVRGIFSRAGFKRVPNISDKQFRFQNQHQSDFDDVFVYENVVVFLEYTVTQSNKISDHLKPKKIIYDAVQGNKNDFLDYIDNKFPTFKASRNSIYTHDDIQIVILYCSKYDIDQTLKLQVNNIKYLDYPILKYFKAVTEAVKLSSRFELFKFFGIEFKQVGDNIFKTNISKKEIPGTILPEKHSSFKKGHKVVSFYIDPNTLLTNSYVLRKDGWRDEVGVYQRMIIKKKLFSIRKYLLTEERVFINNIVVTLPPETKIKDGEGNTIDVKNINSTQPVTIEIPDAFNVIGLIDGQHRVFAYHEGGERDAEIATLRVKQNLLVTGIVYPRSVTESEKSKFEAKLFLEINANQTNAKSELKQAIGLLLNPFSTESIARFVVYRLNVIGALMNKFEKHFYEKGKIKTTSIVSYGLKPIVKLSGTDSFFHLWKNPDKANLITNQDETLLQEYIEFCSSQLNMFFNAVREVVGESRWTTDESVKNRILSTTTINGLIICFRKLIEESKTGDFKAYKSKLSGLASFSFSKYKSSQYGAMGRELYNKFFTA